MPYQYEYSTVPILSKRYMFLVVTPDNPDNIDDYLRMSPNEIIKMFHHPDNEIQSKIPSVV